MANWLVNWITSNDYKFVYMVKGCEVFSNKKYTIVVDDKKGLRLMYPLGYYARFEKQFIEQDLESQK